MTKTPQNPASSVSATSAWKRWAFRLGSLLLIPLVVVLGIEFGLRLVGYGYPTSFFLTREIAGRKLLVENQKFGWRFFGPGMARTPRPMEVPVPKPPRTCRIFVFGESAAYGDPKPEFGLPRFLEVLLRDHFPGVEFEVINAAMTGINSHVILPIARDCAKQSGDVWVIYMGNNEVVGPFGSGTVFGQQTPSLGLIRSGLFVKATRTGELFSQLLSRSHPGQSVDPEWEGMAMFLNNQVRKDDPRMPVVYKHFQSNLQDILGLARSRDAGVVLSTVASNLKDCAPFGSEHRLDLTSENRADWERSFELGKQAEKAGQPAQALMHFDQALKMDDRYAELHFRMGRCLLAMGKDEEARAHFVQARDEDSLRFRADTRLNDLIRSAAVTGDSKKITLADAEAELAKASPHGIPGSELLYEHVHFNFDGNYRLGSLLAAKVVEVLPDWVKSQAQPKQTWLSLDQCAQRLAWTGWDQFRTARSVLLRLTAPPFTSQCDHAERYESMCHQLEQLLPNQRPPTMRQAAQTYREAIAHWPTDWVLQRNLGELLRSLGDFTGAEACLSKAIDLLPHDAMGHLELGLLLVQSHHPDQALAQFDHVLQADPRSVAALNGRALAWSQLGKQPESLQALEDALKIKPRAADTRMNLGTALESVGKKGEAREQFRLALQDKIDTPDLLVRAAKICMVQGWVDQAITNFNRALVLNPVDATVHWYLGGALATKGANAEAQGQFAEAVRLDPDFAAAHLGLGIELSRQGHDHEAETEFSQALKIDPNLIDARLRLGISLMRRHELSEAQQQFEQVLLAQPTNNIAQKYLLMIAKGQHPPP